MAEQAMGTENQVTGRQEAVLSINEQLKQINPEFPRVELSFYYGRHGDAEDARRLKPYIDACDIYSQEMFGAPPHEVDFLNEISKGEITPEEAMADMEEDEPHREYKEQLYKNLYKTNKVVISIDVPEGDPLEVQNEILERQRPEIGEQTTYEEAKKMLVDYQRKTTDFDVKRETENLGRIVPRLAELFKTNPELCRKGEVTLLVSMGTGHSPMTERIKSEHPKDIFILISPLEGLTFGDELENKLRNGEEPDELLVSRTLFEDLFHPVITEYLRSAGEKERYADGFVDRVATLFTEQDIREFFEQRNSNVIAFVFVRLSEKGHVFEPTKEGIIKFIKK